MTFLQLLAHDAEARGDDSQLWQGLVVGDTGGEAVTGSWYADHNRATGFQDVIEVFADTAAEVLATDFDVGRMIGQIPPSVEVNMTLDTAFEAERFVCPNQCLERGHCEDDFHFFLVESLS